MDDFLSTTHLNSFSANQLQTEKQQHSNIQMQEPSEEKGLCDEFEELLGQIEKLTLFLQHKNASDR